MKIRSRLYTLIVLLLCSSQCVAQQYFTMPINNASWRYRIYNLDNNITIVTDQLLLVNGEDTMVNGVIYHKVMSRYYQQTGPENFDPPVVSQTAMYPDIFYTGIREDNKKVYKLSGAGEFLMYDFNAQVNDSIPAYVGKVKVTATDSVLLDGAYHKRYLTTDTGYYVIEGVGASTGLIINLNDNSGFTPFYCFKNNSLVFSPRNDIPCTDIYPYVALATGSVYTTNDVKVYPSPFSDELNVVVASPSVVSLYNMQGEILVAEQVNEKAAFNTVPFPRGVYFLKTVDVNGKVHVVKLVK